MVANLVPSLSVIYFSSCPNLCKGSEGKYEYNFLWHIIVVLVLSSCSIKVWIGLWKRTCLIFVLYLRKGVQMIFFFLKTWIVEVYVSRAPLFLCTVSDSRCESCITWIMKINVFLLTIIIITKRKYCWKLTKPMSSRSYSSAPKLTSWDERQNTSDVLLSCFSIDVLSCPLR